MPIFDDGYQAAKNLVIQNDEDFKALVIAQAAFRLGRNADQSVRDCAEAMLVSAELSLNIFNRVGLDRSDDEDLHFEAIGVQRDTQDVFRGLHGWLSSSRDPADQLVADDLSILWRLSTASLAAIPSQMAPRKRA